MSYTEMKELGEKQLSDLFEIGDYDEEMRRKMIVAFVEGFLQGEINQMKVHINILAR